MEVAELPLHRVVEAILFAAAEPLPANELVLRTCAAAGLPAGTLQEAELTRLIGELNAELQATGRPYRVVQIAGGYALAATPEAAQWLDRAFVGKARRKLSQAALEVLAIVAYRQPITRAEIDTIRGVSSGEVVQSLVERGLLTVVGRAAAPGRPALYGTTPQFLALFGFTSLEELPPLEEFVQRASSLFEPVHQEVFETQLRQLRLLNHASEQTEPGSLPEEP